MPTADEVPICEKCGQPHQRVTNPGPGSGHKVSTGGRTGPTRPTCSGHVTHDRASYVPGQPRVRLDQPRPCLAWRPKDAGPTWRCRMHCGTPPHVKAKRARDKQRAEAEKLMATLGEPVNDGRDYSEVIAERVSIRRGHVQWLHARVQALDPEALAWGITKRKTAVNIDRPSDEQDDGHERRHYAGTDEGDTLEAKPSIWYLMYTEAARELEKLCIEAIRVGVEQRRLQMDERMADQWVRVIDGIVTALGHDPNAPETAEIVARHLELVA